MITHDIDSSTGLDTLSVFVDYEKENGIEAIYNVTVHYLDDVILAPIYIGIQSVLEYIRDNGQTLGSHSVGHFFDFADDELFPKGAPNNTPENYLPFNDGTITTGGTVYGECEVSKNLLEQDVGVSIRSFRAGHLAFNKYLIEVLDELGYEYNSTFSASDVLTNFPYQNKKGRSFSGELSNVYEIPVTISDVFHNDPISSTNYLDKADIWLDVALKNRANGAPSVLLIHPNRNYKLAGMAYFLDNLPDDIEIMEMTKFGDFWKAREHFEFETTVEDGHMVVTVSNEADLTKGISFIINQGKLLSSISVIDEANNPLNFTSEDWEEEDLILYYEGVTSGITALSEKEIPIRIYPNPTQEIMNIEIDEKIEGTVQVSLVDMHGKKLIDLPQQGNLKWSIDLSKNHLVSGIYFVVLQTEQRGIARKKIVFMQ